MASRSGRALAAAALALSAGAAGKTAGPDRSAPATMRSDAASLAVDLLDRGAVRRRRAVRGLGGTRMVVRVTGGPSRRPLWQFGYAGAALAHGLIRLDAAGRGKVQIELPRVRHRAECELVLKDCDRTASRKIVILPAAMLAHCAGLLRELQLGIVDERGRVQKIMAEGGVSTIELKTQHAEEHFAGRAVILAGFETAAALRRTCRRFEGRLKKGMSLVIVNPPAGWKRWGIELIEPDESPPAPCHFAADFGQVVLGSDLGTGPWERFLSSPPGSTGLVWFTQAARVDTAGKKNVRRTLVVARDVGQGFLVVTALPQMDNPGTDVVGRCLLKETILWILAKHHDRDRKEH